MTTPKPVVLFVCTHNAGRSALAAALTRHRFADVVTAESAGIDPAQQPSMATIASLAEIGIDDSDHHPSRVAESRVRAADVVVAMKPGLDLPQIPGVRYETWTLPDPSGWDVDGIRGLRDDIDARVQTLIAELTTR